MSRRTHIVAAALVALAAELWWWWRSELSGGGADRPTLRKIASGLGATGYFEDMDGAKEVRTKTPEAQLRAIRCQVNASYDS